MIAFANNFLAGALLTLLLPACVLIAVAVWYTMTVVRQSEARRAGAVTPSQPSAGAEPEVPRTGSSR